MQSVGTSFAQGWDCHATNHGLRKVSGLGDKTATVERGGSVFGGQFGLPEEGCGRGGSAMR
jgi:hypothetical protein